MNGRLMKNNRQAPAQSIKNPIAALPIAQLKAVASGEPIAIPWPDLLPLEVPLTEPTQPPLDALGEILGPAVAKVIEVVQCPDAIAMYSFLAAANLATQTHANVEVDGRVMPISNFYLSVAESGQRKSGADTYAMRPFRLLEQSHNTEYTQAKEQYQIESRVYDAAERTILKGKGDYQSKLTQIKLLGGAPTEPCLPWLLCSDPTFEGLLRLLDQGRGSVGLFSDEGGKFLGGHGMSADNKLKMITGLCGLWDTGTADKARAGEGIMRLFGKRISMHMMFQPGVAAKIIGDKEAQDQGFLARCLLAAPERKTKVYVEQDVSNDPVILRYQNRILSLLPPYNAAQTSQEPRSMRLASDAKGLYITYHDELQRQIVKGTFGKATAHANKAHDIALRLSAMLQVFDGNGDMIDADHYQRGMMIVDYSLKEHVRLNEQAPANDKCSDAAELLEWWRSKGGDWRIASRQDLMQHAPKRMRPKAELEPVLQTLFEHGYIRPANSSGKSNCWELRNVDQK